MSSKENKKIIQGTIIEVNDYSKIARLKGENKKPEQIVKILLDEIPDEELGKLMLVEKIFIQLLAYFCFLIGFCYTYFINLMV